VEVLSVNVVTVWTVKG